MAAHRPLSRARTLLFAVVAPMALFAVLEGGLRLAGWVTLSTYRARATDQGHGAGELWAFGDSYTFGVGADDPASQSWPAVIAQRSGGELTLRNFATPGLNSSEIVASLADAATSNERPRFVAVLAGVNNTRWLGQSGQFCLEEGGGQARLGLAVTGALGGLRTYKVLRHALLAARPPRPADLACAAVAAGFQHLDDGRPDQAEERFGFAAATHPGSGWAQLGLGVAAMRTGRHRDALDGFERAAAAGVAPPAMALARGFSLRAVGRSTEAKAIAERAHPGDLLPFAALLEAWLQFDAGDHEQAAEQFRRLLDDGPGGRALSGGVRPYALDGLGWAQLMLGEDVGAGEAFAAANELGAAMHLTPHLLGWSHLGQGVLAMRRGAWHDADAALEQAARDSSAIATARAMQGWAAAARGDTRRARNQATAAIRVVSDLALATTLLARLDTGAPLDNALEQTPIPRPTIAVQQWLDPGDTRLVGADLLRAAEISRSLGAQLVILTYPQPKAHPELADAHEAAALRAGAIFVDPRPAFDDAHAELGSWEPLLLSDGHPTTRGYRIMGEVTARALGLGGESSRSGEAETDPSR